jgi:hypothetical protein
VRLPCAAELWETGLARMVEDRTDKAANKIPPSVYDLKRLEIDLQNAASMADCLTGEQCELLETWERETSRVIAQADLERSEGCQFLSDIWETDKPHGTSPDAWFAGTMALDNREEIKQAVEAMNRWRAAQGPSELVHPETTSQRRQGDKTGDTTKKTEKKPIRINVEVLACARFVKKKIKSDRGTTKKEAVEEYVEENGGSVISLCRALSANPQLWKSTPTAARKRQKSDK